MADNQYTGNPSLSLELICEHPDGMPTDCDCETAVLASVSAAAIPEEVLEAKRPAVSLTLVLDKSGSMAGEKMRLMRKTAEWVISQLTSRDCLGIVTYDCNVRTALPLIHMDAEGRRAAASVARGIRDGSTTNLSGGLFAGLRQQVRHSSSSTADDGVPENSAQGADNMAVDNDDDDDLHDFEIVSHPGSDDTNIAVPGFVLNVSNVANMVEDHTVDQLVDPWSTSWSQQQQQQAHLQATATAAGPQPQCQSAASTRTPLPRTPPHRAASARGRPPVAPKLKQGGRQSSRLTPSRRDRDLDVDHAVLRQRLFGGRASPDEPAEPTPTLDLSKLRAVQEPPEGAVRAVYLFTDGHANEGLTEPAGIAAAAESLVRGQAVSVHTFGFGDDHDAGMLQMLAARGGLYAYLPSPDDIPLAFADCLGGLMSTVAQTTTLTLTIADDSSTKNDSNTKKKHDEDDDEGDGDDNTNNNRAAAARPARLVGSVDPQVSVRHVGGGGGAGAHALEVDLGELAAEERRDILVTVALPAGAAAPTVRAKLEWVDLLRTAASTAAAAVTVPRRPGGAGTDPACGGGGGGGGNADVRVETQRLRLLTASTLQAAAAAAESADTAKGAAAAVRSIGDALAAFQRSPAKQTPAAAELQAELKQARAELDVDVLASAKRMHSKSASHRMQRGVWSSPSPFVPVAAQQQVQQPSYSTRSKAGLVGRARAAVLGPMKEEHDDDDDDVAAQL